MAKTHYKSVEEYARDIFVKIEPDTLRGIIIKEEWTAASFEKGEVYRVNPLPRSDLVRYTKYVISTLLGGKFDQEFAYILLLMASHLHKRQGTDADYRLMEPASGPSRELPSLRKFEIWNQNEAKKGGANQPPEQKEQEKEGEDIITVKRPAGEASTSTSQLSVVGVKVAEATEYICFYAAYLLRLCIRGIKQPALSYKNMRDRYKKFTGLEPSITLKEPLTTAAIEDLRRILSNDHMIARTWVRQFVPYHDSCDRNSDGDGMITYLAVLPFMYSGMHAVKLFDEVIIESGMEDNILVRNLMHIKTNKALAAMTTIYARWYPRAGAPKTSSVKYARVISPEYFPELQTKACPLLVSMLAHLLKLYKGGSDAAQGDVLEIEGIKSLSPTLKELAKETALVIYENAHKTSTYLYSGPVKKALANIEARRAQERASGDDDEEAEEEVVARPKRLFIK